ncbi:alpha/beta hydrolase family protein [Halorientalis pallida]|uniref:Alpha/beta fold hydrolase n=1 Tax=Halorientalis pallida TaxID=2479928 RepID=A0A498KS62_9EURY|nr:alpha/beta fold hydrolase [Halorientalis pallida]RXK47236.1 alpha/beta fold hydrolase [Halorientalis pallida]
MVEVKIDERVGLLVLSLVLVFGGGALGYWGHTAGGSVAVQDVQFEGTNGTTMSGHLYVPEGVSAENPAPGVLAVHGYINTKQVQAPFATEYARRGYVVLALDQTGHGGSEPPAFANAFGGPDGLAYLQSRSMVANDSIAISGHSMGGWAITAAAAVHPRKYDAALYQGSGPGPIPGFPIPNATAPNGSATFPRNVGVVFAEYDEFHWLMWGAPAADNAGVRNAAKTKAIFGSDGPVEEGRVYGDVESGSARKLTTPATTHPGAHLSRAVVADSVEWLQQTVPTETDLGPTNQVWYWKEVGTLLALFGAVLFVFPAGSRLLDRDPFAAAVDTVPGALTERTGWWYANAAVAAMLPALTYYPAMILGDQVLSANAVFPQTITNGVAIWALVNTLVAVAFVGIWHVRRDGDGDALARYGLATGENGGAVTRALGVAVAVVGAVYLSLFAVDTLFNVDYRVWFVALKLLQPWHVGAFLVYLPVFGAFFVALGVLLHGRLRTPATTTSLRRAMATNTAIVVGGFVLLVAVQYVPLLLDHALAIPPLALYAIVSLSFLPVLTAAALLSTYFYHRTGRVWTGAFVNAVLITWFLVASTATQAPI